MPMALSPQWSPPSNGGNYEAFDYKCGDDAASDPRISAIATVSGGADCTLCTDSRVQVTQNSLMSQ
jgi:hypothetical protein